MIEVGLDTETYLIMPGRLAPRLVCVSLSGGRLYDREEGLRVARSLLEDPLVTIVVHNAAYDMGVLAANDPSLLELIFDEYEAGRIRCTQNRETLREIALGTFQRNKDRKGYFTLASCIERHLGLVIGGKQGEDIWRYRYAELAGLPISEWPGGAVSYAKDDADYHLRLFRRQQDLPDETPQACAAFALHLMAAWGLRANPEEVVKYKAYLLERIRHYETKGPLALVAQGLMSPKKDGTLKKNLKVIRSLVVEQATMQSLPESIWRGQPTEKMRAEGLPGNVKYDHGMLQRLPCVGRGCGDGHVCDNVLHRLDAIGQDKGEISKYMRYLEAATVAPVNARVRHCIATGRTAIGSPPWQQLPRRKGIRDCIEARPGRVFIGADYDANELVTLAQVLLNLFGRSKLAEILQAGMDPHLYTASMLLGITYDEAVRRRALPKKHLLAAEIKSFRQLGKALGFGFPGGLGAKTFIDYARDSWGVKVTEREARAYKRQWLQWYPEMALYFEHISELTGQGGATVIQPVSGRIRGDTQFCNACNTNFQGLAADMTKTALWLITRQCYGGRLDGARVVLFMHDEVILEAPEDRAAEYAEIVAEIMVLAGDAYCPNVPSKASPFMSKRWHKEAETMRDENGRLMLWAA